MSTDSKARLVDVLSRLMSSAANHSSPSDVVTEDSFPAFQHYILLHMLLNAE